ncbi:hypothetical protein ACJX0J_018559, partial [Zea mays]
NNHFMDISIFLPESSDPISNILYGYSLGGYLLFHMLGLLMFLNEEACFRHIYMTTNKDAQEIALVSVDFFSLLSVYLLGDLIS